MATKDKNPGRTAANLLISPSSMNQILRLKTAEDVKEVIFAMFHYFLSDYKQLDALQGAISEFIFEGIKSEIDRNEQHCAETREKNRKGGQATQQRRREAMGAERPATLRPPKRTKELSRPDCTLANLCAFAIENGIEQDTALEAAQAFWDYNAEIGNIDKTDAGEYRLTADTKGRPLYDWQKAFIGFINSQYDRAEWERANGIDPKTHKPCQR